MPPTVETNRVYTRRLALKHRQIQIKRKQTDLHLKKKKKEPRILTPGERKARIERQASKQEYETKKVSKAQDKVWEIAVELSKDLGKTPEHWHQCLMQLARISKAKRKTSQWNAFVSKQLEERNAG